MIKAGAELLGSILRTGVRGAAGGAGRAWVNAGFETASLGSFAWGATKSAVAGGGWSKSSMLKSGLIGGAKWGAGDVLGDLADTPWGQEQSGVARLVMHLGAFGFKASAVRNFAQGAVGSGLSAAGRMQGDAGRYFRASTKAPITGGQLRGILQHPYGTAGYHSARQQAMTGTSLYDRVVKQKLGSVLQPGNYTFGNKGGDFMGGTGSLYGMVARKGLGAMVGAGKVAGRLPAQVALGMPEAAVAGARMAGKGGRVAIGAGAHIFGKGAWGRGFMKGGSAFADMVTPQSMYLGRSGNAAIGRGMQKIGMINREGHGMIMAGTLGLVGAGALGNAAHQFNKGIHGNAGMSPIPMKPRHFQGGSRANMRGPFKNYGPALTLALHNNHSRVM